jgi:hypothetical protein
METLIQDLRYALRMLSRNPGFTAIAIVSLALGNGLNTSIFTLVNTALLRPLPVERPQQIVSLRTALKGVNDSFNLSYPMYLDVRERGEVYSGVAAARFVTVSLSTGSVNERLWGYLATGNYFQLLGVPAALGRTFTEEEDRAEGADPYRPQLRVLANTLRIGPCCSRQDCALECSSVFNHRRRTRGL